MTAKLPLFLLLAVGPLTARAETIHLEAERMIFVLSDGWVEIPEQIRIQRMAEIEQALAKPRTPPPAGPYRAANQESLALSFWRHSSTPGMRLRKPNWAQPFLPAHWLLAWA